MTMVGSTDLFESEINKNSPEFKERDHAMKFLVTRMHSDEEKIKLGGGVDSIKQQHSKGRLTARERIDHLIDRKPDFLELAIYAGHEMYLASRRSK